MENKKTNTCLPNTWLYQMLAFCHICFRYVLSNETSESNAALCIDPSNPFLSLSPQVHHSPEFAKMLYVPELYITHNNMNIITPYMYKHS